MRAWLTFLTARADAIDELRRNGRRDFEIAHDMCMDETQVHLIRTRDRSLDIGREPAAQAPAADCDECDALRMNLADLLTRTANALRGQPEPGRRWSWHDVPERAAAAIAAIGVMQRCAASLAAESEGFRQAVLDPENQPSQYGTVLLAQAPAADERALIEGLVLLVPQNERGAARLIADRLLASRSGAVHAAPNPAWLLDSYQPPEAAIRAGGDCIGAAELQAMVQEELHPDDIALRIWYAMRPAIADQVHPADASAQAPADRAADERSLLIGALEKINEWCCFASEEDTSARLMALQQIGLHARSAVAAVAGASPLPADQGDTA